VSSWQNENTALWEQRYVSQSMWSGKVNPTLQNVVSTLPQGGSALDVGAGEGADALWLAEQGFDTTAVDASPSALRRGEKERVARITRDHTPRIIRWIASDVVTESLPERDGGYTLVTSQFLHIPKSDRSIVWQKLVDQTALGGTLIIIAHSVNDLEAGVRRPPRELLFDEKELLEAVPSSWSEARVSLVERTQTSGVGEIVSVTDIVLIATR
jgi:SAM-dependent methyltransferase